MSASAENRLIDWLRRRLKRCGEDLVGDDAAVIRSGAATAVTVDQQISGVHFPPDLDAAVVARRLVAVNLSDLAAMGALPRWAFLALTIPPELDVRRFFRAILRACADHDLVLAGGDVARAEHLHVSMTVIGARPPRGRWLSRANARPGDSLWLGGTLGESAAGRLLGERGARLAGGRVELPELVPPDLEVVARRAVRRHFAPRPQIELGLRLGQVSRVAAIDLSDGLSLDLGRLCRESRVGATIDRRRLPASAGLARLADLLSADRSDLMLGGGEDYVLLFTLPGAGRTSPPPGCHRIGAITASADLRITDASGSGALPEVGWDHLNADRR